MTIQFIFLLLFIVKRYNVELLCESPPPLETELEVHVEALLPRPSLELDHEVPDPLQGVRGTPVVGHHRDLAAELHHLHLLGAGQSDGVEDLHPAGLAQDVVIQRPLGDPELDAGLGKPQPLGDHAVDGFKHLTLGPGRTFDTKVVLCFLYLFGFIGNFIVVVVVVGCQ